MLLASDYDKSKYLKATDLDREKKFRIKVVTEEVLNNGEGGKEKKLVVWFTNDERGLVLNKTNIRTLKGAFGDPVVGWATKVIAVYPMMAANGKPGLRVRVPPPKQSAATAEVPQQPVKSGNGAAAPSGNGAAAAPPVAAVQHDPELEPDPVKPLKEELDDEISF